jgi:hypothetical protein
VIEIDPINWNARMVISSYGVRIGISANSPCILSSLRNCLPPGWKSLSSVEADRWYSLVVDSPADSGTAQHSTLFRDADKLIRSTDQNDVLEVFESSLQLYVAEFAKDRVFIHAGVVGWQGKAILIPGRSFSGKTTLVAELLRAGASYYSDEYAVLDKDGYVHPYSKPLAIREHGTARQTKYGAEALGGRRGTEPLPIGVIVVSRYTAGARWRPRYLSQGLGAMALLDNTVSARRQPEIVLNTLQKAVAHATILKGIRGEAGETVKSILKEASLKKEA